MVFNRNRAGYYPVGGSHSEKRRTVLSDWHLVAGVAALVYATWWWGRRKRVPDSVDSVGLGSVRRVGIEPTT